MNVRFVRVLGAKYKTGAARIWGMEWRSRWRRRGDLQDISYARSANISPSVHTFSPTKEACPEPHSSQAAASRRHDMSASAAVACSCEDGWGLCEVVARSAGRPHHPVMFKYKPSLRESSGCERSAPTQWICQNPIIDSESIGHTATWLCGLQGARNRDCIVLEDSIVLLHLRCWLPLRTHQLWFEKCRET